MLRCAGSGEIYGPRVGDRETISATMQHRRDGSSQDSHESQPPDAIPVKPRSFRAFSQGGAGSEAAASSGLSGDKHNVPDSPFKTAFWENLSEHEIDSAQRSTEDIQQRPSGTIPAFAAPRAPIPLSERKRAR